MKICILLLCAAVSSMEYNDNHYRTDFGPPYNPQPRWNRSYVAGTVVVAGLAVGCIGYKAYCCLWPDQVPTVLNNDDNVCISREQFVVCTALCKSLTDCALTGLYNKLRNKSNDLNGINKDTNKDGTDTNKGEAYTKKDNDEIVSTTDKLAEYSVLYKCLTDCGKCGTDLNWTNKDTNKCGLDTNKGEAYTKKESNPKTNSANIAFPGEASPIETVLCKSVTDCAFTELFNKLRLEQHDLQVYDSEKNVCAEYPTELQFFCAGLPQDSTLDISGFTLKSGCLDPVKAPLHLRRVVTKKSFPSLLFWSGFYGEYMVMDFNPDVKYLKYVLKEGGEDHQSDSQIWYETWEDVQQDPNLTSKGEKNVVDGEKFLNFDWNTFGKKFLNGGWNLENEVRKMIKSHGDHRLQKESRDKAMTELAKNFTKKIILNKAKDENQSMKGDVNGFLGKAEDEGEQFE